VAVFFTPGWIISPLTRYDSISGNTDDSLSYVWVNRLKRLLIQDHLPIGKTSGNRPKAKKSMPAPIYTASAWFFIAWLPVNYPCRRQTPTVCS